MIALAGGAALDACLGRLAPWHARCDVVLGENMGTAAEWRARHAGVRFAEGAGLTVPQRRQRAVAAVTAAWVAILEDTSLPGPGWLAAIDAALARPGVAAASGPVHVDPRLAPRAQALACTEYGRSFPGRLSRPAGNNLAYRRDALAAFLADRPQGLLESELHAQLAARGQALELAPGMAVTYAAPDPHGIRLATRFHHGRLYAASRAASWPAARRLAFAAGSLLLPVVLSMRSLAAMASGVRASAWPSAGAWIVAMETAWALGECAGYAAGGGASAREWR